MGAPLLDALDDDGDGHKREAVVREVCRVLESVMKREEDGSWWMGYVRLRVLARKT